METTSDSSKSNSISTRGNVHIVIGPNGFGKTTYLEGERKRLENAGENVFFIPSEIKLLDEVKDTVDTSQTMEFLLTELLETPEYLSKKKALYDEADKIISENVDHMNDILDGILQLNGSARTKDFIAPNPKRTIKNLISINQKDVKDKMGSGQRMHLLLELASNSSRDCIFLDEPEKYSHPSLLNITASLINNLIVKGKQVYLATHSPKLLSMIDFDYTDLKIINDSSHSLKSIPFDDAVARASSYFNVGAMPSKFKRYYTDGETLKNSISRRQNRQFIEALFSKRVYLCEGANDELLINAALRKFGGYFDDYCIFKAWGKSNLPVFAELFSALGIDVICLFDVDDESKPTHKEANNAIRSVMPADKLIELKPNLESEVGFKGDKRDALALMDHLEAVPLDAKFDLAAL